MTHSEVVQRYSERKINRRNGEVCWRGTNVTCDGDFVYSYGVLEILIKHFMLKISMQPWNEHSRNYLHNEL